MEGCHRQSGARYVAICNTHDLSRELAGVELVALDGNTSRTLVSGIQFMMQYGALASRLLKRNSFDIVHHMFPFGYERGFNPLALLNRLGKAAFVIGPIQYPQRYSDVTDYQFASGQDLARASINMAAERTLIRFLSTALRTAHKRTLDAARVMVFDSRTTLSLYRQAYEGIESKNTFEIPQGVDTETFYPRMEYRHRPLEILTTGYLTRRKGIDLLLKAFSNVRESFPNLRLQICGDGPAEADLKALSSKMGLKEHVMFDGYVDRQQLPYYYSRSQLYVQPSLSETLPAAVLEAISCGTPVVLSDVGLHNEYFKGKGVGELVPPKDVYRLAETITHFLERDDERESMSARAREYALTTFDWNVLSDKWTMVYESALNN